VTTLVGLVTGEALRTPLGLAGAELDSCALPLVFTVGDKEIEGEAVSLTLPLTVVVPLGEPLGEPGRPALGVIVGEEVTLGEEDSRGESVPGEQGEGEGVPCALRVVLRDREEVGQEEVLTVEEALGGALVGVPLGHTEGVLDWLVEALEVSEPLETLLGVAPPLLLGESVGEVQGDGEELTLAHGEGCEVGEGREV